MKLLLSGLLLWVGLVNAAAQEGGGCVAAGSAGEYVVLSSGLSHGAPDAKSVSSVGRGCGAGEPSLRAPSVAAPVSVLTLAVPPRARKAFERARRAIARRPPDLAAAEHELRQALEWHDGFAEAWDLLGRLLLKGGDLEGAKDAFARAIQHDPAYAGPQLGLAFVAVLQQRHLEALRLSERALRMNPALSEAHYYRASACHALERTECAMESARAVVGRGDDGAYPRVHLIIGDLLAGMGDYRSAAAEYNRLTELEPGSRAAAAANQLLAQWKVQGLLSPQ